ncbi:hypothetical protein [Bacillus thuringiensis]|uniref:hypothetical protein n=1 Tax=Bacillus thuringiensis TaxID=1428 RepID=UPI003017E137
MGSIFFQNLHIPPAKVERLAAEAKTLDAARMKELEPHKRYTLAISLLHVQHAKRLTILERCISNELQKLKIKRKELSIF